MSQPKKRRRLNEEEEKDKIKNLMKEVLAEALPAITETVVATVKETLRVTANKDTSSQSNQSNTGSNLEGISMSSTSSATLPVTSAATSSVASSATSPAPSQETLQSSTTEGNKNKGTGPLHIGRPLGQGIDTKIKAKIWAEEFIQLGCLVFKQPYAKLEAVQASDNSVTFLQKEHKYFFKSLQQWTGAFHVFVAIYCEKFPEQAPNLMKYMATVQKLSSDVGERAAFHYDEQFRKWRAENLDQMPWEKINSELHSEALQIGLKSKLFQTEGKTSRPKQNQQQPFRIKNNKKPCFSFNNNAGQCARSNCEYAHICSKCFGDHNKKDCRLPDNNKKPNHSNTKPANTQTPFKK
ncbi:uncharacterized protein LOC134283613 isoform X3 [Saccostrea cucullata]|uniref:uncharacterized protein LOC134283613 isoform X3 n=1 Tax=Saccostrea cuccullata TaxID=36930 RepID=UPI002ED078A3